MIPFGRFEPDRTKYAPDATTNVINCLPVADGWGPMPDVSVISTALGTACLGAVYVRTAAGAYRVIAGTATKLYEFDSATLGWTDITRLVGGDYAVPAGDNWSFQPFGLYLVAVNLNDDPQYLDIGSGANFAAIPGSPPKAKYAWISGEFLVLGHLAGFPNKLQTSGIGDLSYWEVGRRGCDVQDFAEGEEIVGGIGAERGAIVFHRTIIRQMLIQSSGDFSFSTNIINPSRGVVAPLSIASIGPGRFVYYSADGFMMGAEGTPIGLERVDKWFAAEISSPFSVKAMVDPYQKIVWFKGVRADGSGFLLGYQWALDRWCYSDAAIEAMAALVTPGITIDGMDAYYATIDDVDEPFDSRLFTGGSPTMAVFDTSHRLCYLTGGARAATLQTPDIQHNPRGRSYLRQARVIGDAGVNFTLKAITAAYHGGTRTTGNAVTPYPATALCHFRSSALTHAFLMEIPSGADWNHVIGVEPATIPEGDR